MSNLQTKSQGAEGIRWDLSDLYNSIEDPKIEKDLKEIDQAAESFEETYRSKIKNKNLDPDTLLRAVQQLEQIFEKSGKILSFASLVFSGNNQDPRNGAFMQAMREKFTEIRKHLIFFDLEWLSLSDKKVKEILNKNQLAHYRHFLETERKYKPHRLSEPEEKILDEKSNTGISAFERLFEEVISAVQFPMKRKGEIKNLTEQEILALLHDPDREIRKEASSALTLGLKSNCRILNFIFNVVVAEHASNDRLRSYSGPMSSRHLSNEIEPRSVETLLNRCEENYNLVARYYHLKRRILGLEKLYDYDRYAPMLQENRAISYKECQETVLSSFGDFSPKMREIASLFFEKNWIDAELRPGKRGGAFSHGTVPSVHPYILVNYTGRPRDVMTVAHELGHGIHQYLSRGQGYFQSDTPLTTAETASVFGEMLVFHTLKGKETDPKARLALLCGKLEDIFATVFRQVTMTRFEQRLHHARREQGELSDTPVNALWLEANRNMFKDSVELREDYGWWWLYITHFIHSPFYCYAYAFGELLVLALYKCYLNDGQTFVPKYLDLLSAGGSDKPENLLKKVGVDITAFNFWDGGLELIRNLVDEAEDLAKETGF
ncbi:MAG TPA: M3 family oligoendopeptidase [Nitrospiria bacterium]